MYNNRHHQFNEQYNHKLFAHVNGWNPDVIPYIADLKPKVVKFLDPNLNSVQAVRELVPDALLIYRRWQPEQPLGNTEAEAFVLGKNFAKAVLGEQVVQAGLVDLVEGYNEILGETASRSEHLKFAKFQLGFHQELVGSPVKPIAFNFGTGNMSAELILQYYSDVLDAYDWLGFHEYDWPTMDRLHNQGLQDGNGGMWLALRYRRIMQPIIEAKGNNWSVLITECGMTQGVLGGEDVGFLFQHNMIPGNSHPTPISNDDYYDTLKWYSDELMKDDYVAGACMFTTGELSPWESFETIGTITPKIKEDQRIVENGGNVSDIFVNDVRANDDPSLQPVPRIETFEELKRVFGLGIDTTHGGDRAQTGQRYWKLVGFEVRTGPKVYITQVKESDGSPAANVVVFRHYKTAPGFPQPVNPPYFNNGVGGFTNENGHQGMEYTETSVTGANGGPDFLWVSADPAGGLRIGSDMAARLGWIGGTNHLTANPIFQDTLKGSIVTPGDNPKLVIFDATGAKVGEVTLQSGNGNGGRIALFTDGEEQAHVDFD